MKDILKKIEEDSRVKNIIETISSEKYDTLSFKEKSDLFKEFNKTIANIAETELTLNINKTSKRNLSRNITIKYDEHMIAINGLDKNPYVYLKDIIIYNLYFLYNENTPSVEVGDVSFIDNYIESDFNIILYDESNVEIVEESAKTIARLISNINNKYTYNYKKEFDLNISEQAKEELRKANIIFDEDMKLGFYDGLKAIEEHIKNIFIDKREPISKKDIALLSLDQIMIDVFIKLHPKNVIFNNIMKLFMSEFFNEFKDAVIIKGSKNGIYINDKLLYEDEFFIDDLFKEIEKVNNKLSIIDNTHLHEYFFSRLNELDSYLENRDLEAINYVKWTSIYKYEKEDNIFEGNIELFLDLIENEEFLSTVRNYLSGKSKNITELKNIFNFLNESYYNADFELIIEDEYGETSMGSAGVKSIIINTRNNNDKISTLTTLFHEYKHLIQQRELEENHNIYTEKALSLIECNNRLSKFNVAYGYFECESCGYQNTLYYQFQPSEYDAEYFSYIFSKAILDKLNIKKDYTYYFPSLNINSKFLSMPDMSINLYNNFLRKEEVSDSYTEDEQNYNSIMSMIDNMKNSEDASNIIKNDRFIYLDIEEKIKVYKMIAGDKLKLNYDKGILKINNKTIDTLSNHDYTIIESIIIFKAIEKFKNKELKLENINNYIYNESLKYKPENFTLYNILVSYYYHDAFDKYIPKRQEKKQTIGHKR